MQINTGAVFPIPIAEEGTLLDYVDGEWLFLFKDYEWCEHEVKGVSKKPIQIDFVYKYDIAIFLLTIEDVIDTSDFIFCIHDNEYPSQLVEESMEGFQANICLLDHKNVVVAQRKISFSKSFSNQIKDMLKKQKEAPFYEAEFACNLSGLQDALEPFEMQEIALASERY